MSFQKMKKIGVESKKSRWTGPTAISKNRALSRVRVSDRHAGVPPRGRGHTEVRG